MFAVTMRDAIAHFPWGRLSTLASVFYRVRLVRPVHMYKYSAATYADVLMQSCTDEAYDAEANFETEESQSHH